MTVTSVKLAAAAAMTLALTAGGAFAGSEGSFEATLQIEGADICADLAGLTSTGNSGSSTYQFTGVDATTGVVTATGNSITIALADADGGTVMCNSPTDKKVSLQSQNGALIPAAGINVDSTNFADKVTYNVTSIVWGPDQFVTKDLPQASADLVGLGQIAYTKQGAAVGNVEVGLALDATSLPLIATTYEDVLTIIITDGNVGL